jgi:DNA-directed RNA polymerase I, II, and III subunit RPABC3
MSSIIFEDIFLVQDIDKDGKKFDRVSRLFCRSETYEMELILDINTEIYPMEPGQKFTMALARTLNLDGTPDEGGMLRCFLSRFPRPILKSLSVYDQSDKRTIADDYSYVMYGKVFKYTHEKAPSVKVYASSCFFLEELINSLCRAVYISYGGLLMMLKGDQRNLQVSSLLLLSIFLPSFSCWQPVTYGRRRVWSWILESIC